MRNFHEAQKENYKIKLNKASTFNQDQVAEKHFLYKISSKNYICKQKWKRRYKYTNYFGDQ